MLKILSNHQIRQADAATIQKEPIESIDLMERASLACAAWLKNNLQSERIFHVFAGIGNNGGDALAIARLLSEEGFDISVYIVAYAKVRSPDFQINIERLEMMGVKLIELNDESEFPELGPSGCVIDGMFGSGLSRAPDGISANCISGINKSELKTISIDLPSGLFADEASTSDYIVRANHTLCFQLPKVAFMLPVSGDRAGKSHILDIRLDGQFINTVPTDHFYIDQIHDFKTYFERKKFGNKGTYGHTLIAAGSVGKIGAAVMSSKAAMRAGCGLVTAYIPMIGYDILQTAVPEAMAIADAAEGHLKTPPELEVYDSIAVGPGLGMHQETVQMLELMLEQSEHAVIDADALNIIAKNPSLFSKVKPNSILTPHPKEFERLFGASKDDFERLMKLKTAAKKHMVYIVLKGAHTAVACPDGTVYFNSTGNPGMATGGSGDVLTGIIAGLYAQCKDAFVASVCGVFIHGIAGDIAAESKGVHGLIATDIIDSIGIAFKQSFSLES